MYIIEFFQQSDIVLYRTKIFRVWIF